jgi:DNA modification methylase
MRRMISEGMRVQMCVTSPPYYGLRDYGHPGQLGLEATPDEYIANMVEVFRLVRDLLADNGTLWLNIGDSYANDGKWGGSSGGKHVTSLHGNTGIGRGKKNTGLKPKDLIGIPWLLAFALRADGWYLRQDIVWSKPNPMPESVRDRCTKSHEYLFLLSKSERYFFDAEAIKEPVSGDPNAPRNRWDTKNYEVPGQKPQKRVSRSGNKERKPGSDRGCPDNTGSNVCGSVPWEGSMRNKRSVWTIPTSPYAGAHFAVFPPALIEPCILAGSRPSDIVLDPFFGSGTTGEVAQNLGRHWIGCEINEYYAPLQAERTAQMGLAL